MKDYFQELPEYLWRFFSRVDSIGGVFAGVVFAIIALLLRLDTGIVIGGTTAILLVALLEAGYGIHRQDRLKRLELESNVRVTARLGSIAANYPDPGPGKSSLSVHVLWEVWVNQDVSTDALGLNVIYVYDKRWWQFWKKTRFPQIGIPPKGEETTTYRKRIYASELQPFRDDAVFEYVAEQDTSYERHWFLELVLKTGMPIGVHRVPIFIDREELRSRGTYPPL